MDGFVEAVKTLYFLDDLWIKAARASIRGRRVAAR